MDTAEFQALETELRRMGDAMRGLAAIGAVLRLRQGKMEAHPSVEAQLDDVVAALRPGALEGLDQKQMSAALASINLAFEEAWDLFERPDRAPAWMIRDPAMLLAQGQASRFAAHRMIALAAGRPALAAALTGRFLDVGTGVGAIALELAAECLSLSIVGVDIWQPSLALARSNVAASPYAARIEIREQDVTHLSDVAAYTLAWLPTPFMTQAAAQAALDRLTVALAPSGFLVVGFQPAPADPIGAALAGLRLVRSGGYQWDSAALEAELRSRGFIAIETCAGQPATFVIGQRA